MSKILACLSGGVESTYGVYDLLKNTDHDVTLFHLYFRNHPRYEGETEACEYIVNWLEKNTREFSWKSVNVSYSGEDEITQPPHSADICYTIVTTANAGASISGSFNLRIGGQQTGHMSHDITCLLYTSQSPRAS